MVPNSHEVVLHARHKHACRSASDERIGIHQAVAVVQITRVDHQEIHAVLCGFAFQVLVEREQVAPVGGIAWLWRVQAQMTAQPA